MNGVQTGPRGGQFVLTASGKKRYISARFPAPNTGHEKTDSHESLKHFAADVHHAITGMPDENRDEASFMPKKIFISDLADRMGLPLADVKASLIEARRHGLVTMSRSDLRPSSTNMSKIAASETTHMENTVHFVEAPRIAPPVQKHMPQPSTKSSNPIRPKARIVGESYNEAMSRLNRTHQKAVEVLNSAKTPEAKRAAQEQVDAILDVKRELLASK